MSSTRQARLGALAGMLLLATGPVAASIDEATPDALPVAEITARGGPAVVFLRIKSTEERQVGYGSGFLVDPGGTIVTALHMVDRADQVLVRTADGKRFRRITVRSYDVESDVAVLQIDGADLPVVELGGTSEVEPGDPILVIGNPGALTRTVTEGVVGAWREPSPLPEQLGEDEVREDQEFGLRRRLRGVPNIRTLQLSAPLTLGSSGSPVFDRFGEVVGMAVAVASYGELELNFAVPTERIMQLLELDEGLTLASLKRRADLDRADLAEPHIQSARLALEIGQLDEAQREVDAALQLFPSSAEALLVEGRLLRRRGELEAAEEILLQVTRQRPDSAEGWHQLGELYLQKDAGTGLLVAPARKALEKAHELDDSLAGPAHGLGVIAFRQGRFRSATQLLESAWRAEPERAETGLWLGEVHLRMERSLEAEAAFHEALEIAPADPRPHHGLARAFQMTGQDGRARDHYREFLEMTDADPQHEALRERTILYLRHYPHLMPLEYMDLLAARTDELTP